MFRHHLAIFGIPEVSFASCASLHHLFYIRSLPPPQQFLATRPRYFDLCRGGFALQGVAVRLNHGLDLPAPIDGVEVYLKGFEAHRLPVVDSLLLGGNPRCLLFAGANDFNVQAVTLQRFLECCLISAERIPRLNRDVASLTASCIVECCTVPRNSLVISTITALPSCRILAGRKTSEMGRHHM